MPRRYCIAGAWYSSPNIGDQAILATILRTVRSRQPNAHFTVITARPEFVTAQHDVAAFYILKSPLRVFQALSAADVYIIGGGTPFYASASNLGKFLITALIARLCRTRIMVYGVSSRDLYTWWSRRMTGWILNLADYISIREKATLGYFRELFPNLELHSTSDPAIMADRLEHVDGKRLLKDEGIPISSDPLYGFSCRYFDTRRQFNIHHYEEYTAKQIDTLWTALARAADIFAEKGIVVFFPMNTQSPDDDRVSAEIIRERMKKPEKSYVIQKQYEPAEAAAIFREFRCMIASRLHATVISASQNVPSIGLSYGHKTAGFLGALLPSECIFRIENLTDDDLARAAEFVLDNYATILNDFKIQVLKNKGLAEKNVQTLCAL